MTNCYPLSLNSLSDDLNSLLLKFALENKETLGFDVINLKELTDEKSIFLKFHSQTETKVTSYFIIPLSEELKKNVQKQLGETHIPSSKINFYLHYITGDSKFIPHRDPGRTVCLLYNLTDDCGETIWFTSKNHDIKSMYTLDEVEVFETFNLKKHQWYLLNTDEIHAVFNMKGPRIGLTCNLNTDQTQIPNFDSFVKQYANLLVAESRSRT